MRLWSFHPKYLDAVGLSRLINEGISGYKALTGQQKMWQNHPQLTRFKNSRYSKDFLQSYLKCIIMFQLEKKSKEIDWDDCPKSYSFWFNEIKVTEGQLKYEWQHYLKKLQKRNKKLYNELKSIEIPSPHPIFRVVKGDIESWEKVKL